jgi:hypothetical protein
VGDRHHHVLALDQVLVLELALLLDDLGAPRGGEVGPFIWVSSSLMMRWTRARERRMSR